MGREMHAFHCSGRRAGPINGVGRAVRILLRTSLSIGARRMLQGEPGSNLLAAEHRRELA